MLKRILLAISGLVLLTIIGFLSYLSFFRKDNIYPRAVAKEKYTTPASNFFTYKGKEIHYVDEGQGFPVMMIHGFMGSQHNFDALAAKLKTNFRVVRVDLPGFGLSEFFDNKDGQIDLKKEYNQFFTFFIDSLKLDSFHLMGNSMGGMMAWNIAANYPQKVKSLVLLNSAGYDMLNVLDKAAPILQYPFLEPLMARGLPPEGAKAGLLTCYANDSLVSDEDAKFNNAMHNVKGNIQAAFTVAGSGQYPDTNLIKQITSPTLIIWGEEDEIIPVAHSQSFKRDIKNSQLIVYSPCGHVPMMERTDDVERDFLKFIGKGDLSMNYSEKK